MNDNFSARIADALLADLQVFAKVCEELLLLARKEHLALSTPAESLAPVFCQTRKDLLPDLDSLVKKFRMHRTVWQQISEARREQFTELKQLFQNIQCLVMKLLSLDRENQQAMLKRGLVPVKNLPPAAAQQPHFVADLYRRNSCG